MQLLTSALPYLATAALLVVLSALGWRLLTAWLANRRPLLLAAYLFLVLCGVSAGLATRLSSGWIYPVLGVLIGLAILAGTSGKRPAGPSFSRTLLPLSLAISFVPLAVSAAVANQAENTRASASRTAADKATQAMLATASADQESSLQLADLPSSQALDSSAVGFASLRQEALSRTLDFAILTDAKGQVLVRTSHSSQTGDTLTDRLPWTSRALAGETVSGLAWTEDGQLAAIAAVPVLRAGSQVGMIVGGTIITQDYLARQARPRSAILLDGQRLAVYSSATSLDSRLALNSGTVYQATRPQAATFLLELEGKRAIGTVKEVGTLDTSRPFRLLILADE